MNFKFKPNTGLFTSPITGSMQVSSRSGDQWQCEIVFPPMSRADFDAWSAWATRQSSRAEPFYLGEYKTPRNYPSGVNSGTKCDTTTVKCDTTTVTCDAAFGYGNPTVNGASQVGRSLITQGWTANTTIYAGTWIAFENGVFRELHKQESNVTVNGAGAATLLLTPPIRRSPAHNAEIFVDGKVSDINHRCAGEFLIAPGEAVGWSGNPQYDVLSPMIAVEFIR